MLFRFKDHSSSLSSESDSDGEDTPYAGSNALKPIVCLGWQPASDVFVLGETLTSVLFSVLVGIEIAVLQNTVTYAEQHIDRNQSIYVHTR